MSQDIEKIIEDILRHKLLWNPKNNMFSKVLVYSKNEVSSSLSNKKR